MIGISICIVFSICTMLFLSYDYYRERFELRPRILLGLLWLSLILLECFSTIQVGEVGVITRFGRIINIISNEGIFIKSPIDIVEKINVRVQKYENKEALSTFSKDMQTISNIRVAINYQIDDKKIIDLYKKVGVNYNEIILEPVIQETVKAVISKYTTEELIIRRSEISLDIKDTIDSKVKGYGINIISVAINNFYFKDTYN